jgi:hypothetical protein
MEGLRPQQVRTNKPNKSIMKNNSKLGIALAAVAGMVLAVHAQDIYPTITQQPLDQLVAVGGIAQFSVQAANATAYQWYCNNTIMDGQTNDTLVVPNAQISNVGLYSALVFNGADSVPTRSANLNVYVTSSSTSTSTSPMRASAMMSSGTLLSMGDPNGGSVIVVFGFPLQSMGGSGSCPGRYSGYVNYTKTVAQGWGWTPSSTNTVYTCTDTNATNTKLGYTGDYGDWGCNQTTVTVPYPAMSPAYRFTVFFPQGTQVPTNAYPITLSGFNP